MPTEQRREQRSILGRQPQGKLQVLRGEQCHDVYSVKDLSHSGIKVEMGDPLAVGENLELRYVSDAVDMKLRGTVVWNSAADDPPGEAARYVVGIELVSPSLLEHYW